LQEIEDASGNIPWPLDRSPGGADVLKKQAACAFQAFAAKRLRAEPLNRNDWGLSAAERGSILHRTLEKIWSPAGGALHSLDDLKAAVKDGQLGEMVRSAIADVFARFDVARDTWIVAYLMSEQRRLQVRIEEWMKIEAARVPFKVIACEEKLEGVNVGGLQMRLRADRIDEVGNSDRLLIDYKSGMVSPNDWQPPRLNEPQLPLYAIFGKVEDVRGVLFARIRAGDTGFEGSVTDAQAQVFADAGPSSKLMKEPYTESMRDTWHDALLTVADGFLRGEAMVNPKDGKKTCKNCAFPGLCRVAEVRNPLEESGDAEGNDNGE
jgi:RecB family exonuclease